MRVVDLPAPHPAAGQVVIRTEAIGVGGVDAMLRRGTLRGHGFAPGTVPGSEVAGTVVRVGDGVDPDWLARRVWAFTGVGGAYAEEAVADIADVVALPDDLACVDAVTVGSAAPVAHFALAHGRFTGGESVLVRGAAGSIGIAAVQLAARAGARAVAVTTSSPQRGERLRELGATHVLDRAGNGDATTPASFDVILDVVGGPDLPSFLDRLAPGGRFVAVGMVAGLPPADFGSRLLRAFQPRHRSRRGPRRGPRAVVRGGCARRARCRRRGRPAARRRSGGAPPHGRGGRARQDRPRALSRWGSARRRGRASDLHAGERRGGLMPTQPAERSVDVCRSDRDRSVLRLDTECARADQGCRAAPLRSWDASIGATLR